MNADKAKEIMESKGYFHVVCNDRPVWLEGLRDNGKIQVRDMTNEETKEVDLSEIQELDGINELGS